jgi:hypothetical protein
VVDPLVVLEDLPWTLSWGLRLLERPFSGWRLLFEVFLSTAADELANEFLLV